MLGSATPTQPVDSSILQNGPILSDAHRDMLCRAVTREEIKAAVFSIGSDKAPGPDGFSAGFFKAAWDIIQGDVTRAVQD